MSALNRESASNAFGAPIFCGSSMITIGLLALMTSIGRRDWKSSSTSYIRRLSLLVELNAWMLMIITCTPASELNRSSS